MKVLYIHGLNSQPTPEKLDIIAKCGMEPVYLKLDYRNQPNSYQLILEKAQSENVEMVIGSSLGGYFGFWISEELGVPCLLFNPALNVPESLPLIQPSKKTRRCPLRMVVVGAHDDVLNPEETLNALKLYQRPTTVQKVVTCHWLAHQIDLQSFEEMIYWAKFNVHFLNKVKSQ